MTPEMAQRVIGTMYDRLFDVVTYQPPGGAPFNNPSRTFLHLSKHEAISPNDFSNAKSPLKPTGDLGQAEAFSAMVDAIPEFRTEYAPRGGTRVSSAYGTIVMGANSNDPTTTEAGARYEKALQHLRGPLAADYAVYTEAKSALEAAYIAYRTTYNGFDLTDPVQQSAWTAAERGLKANIEAARRKLALTRAAEIEELLQTLEQTRNSAIRIALDRARATWNASESDWQLSYANPSNWAEDAGATNFTEFSLSSSSLKTSLSERFTSYGGSGSFGLGLWSFGAGASGSEQFTRSQMNAETFSLTAKIATVRIQRPWFDDTLFYLSKWSVGGIPAGHISNGRMAENDNGVLPLIPVMFIVARDVKIAAQITAEEREIIAKSFTARGSVGWGPFSVSGNYSHSSREEYFKSQVDEGGIVIPGIQIIGWVSSLVPAAPPL
jgi:hypothetical protein